MPRSIEVYQKFGTLEWCNKYFIAGSNVSTANTIAQAVRDMQKPLQTTGITYTRYRHLDSDGTLMSEGALTGTGTVATEMMPIHYALLLRITVSTEVGRPSSKYIHGWPETFQADNSLSAAGITAISNAGLALAGAGLANSQGAFAQNFIFRNFSRRKRMRVMGT